MRKATDTDGKFEQTESCVYLTERKYHYFYLTDQKESCASRGENKKYTSARVLIIQHLESPPAFHLHAKTHRHAHGTQTEPNSLRDGKHN